MGSRLLRVRKKVSLRRLEIHRSAFREHGEFLLADQGDRGTGVHFHIEVDIVHFHGDYKWLCCTTRDLVRRIDRR